MAETSAPPQSSQPEQPESSAVIPHRQLGFVGKQIRQVRLFWRCFWDRRVSGWLKVGYLTVTPIATVVVSALPDPIPFADEILIYPWVVPIAISYLFTEAVPRWLVAEHLKAIEQEEQGQIVDDDSEGEK